MNIAYVSDNNYADIMGVSITSLFENNKNCNEINVFIIDNNISKENKNKLNQLSIKYNRNITFIPFPDLSKLIDVEINVRSWSISAFGRLFLELLIPDNIDKILYLDCDTLINDSIKELYETDIKEKYCGMTPYMQSLANLIVGLNAEDQWLNSGIMLISLNKWRENKLYKKFIKFINERNGDIPLVDEGVLNGTIHSQTMKLPYKYNVYCQMFYYKSSQKAKSHNKYIRICNGFWDDNTLNIIRNNPVIVHFTNSDYYFRPWIKPCFGCKMYPYTDEWLKYKAISPWADEPLRSNKGKLKKQIIKKIKYVIVDIYTFILDILPKKISQKISNTVIKSYYMKRI